MGLDVCLQKYLNLGDYNVTFNSVTKPLAILDHKEVLRKLGVVMVEKVLQKATAVKHWMSTMLMEWGFKVVSQLSPGI